MMRSSSSASGLLPTTLEKARTPSRNRPGRTPRGGLEGAGTRGAYQPATPATLLRHRGGRRGEEEQGEGPEEEGAGQEEDDEGHGQRERRSDHAVPVVRPPGRGGGALLHVDLPA